MLTRLNPRPEVIERLREQLMAIGTPQLTVDDERFLRDQFGTLRSARRTTQPTLIAA